MNRNNAKRVSEEFAIDEAHYWNAAPKVFEATNGVYSFRLHAELTAEHAEVDSEAMVSFFEHLFANENSPQYVLTGAKKFLQGCAQLGKTIILTLGENENQSRRASESELSTMAHQVLVTQGDKGDEVHNYLGSFSGKLIVMDDTERHLDAVRRRFPGCLALHAAICTDKPTLNDANVRVASYDEAMARIREFLDL